MGPPPPLPPSTLDLNSNDNNINNNLSPLSVHKNNQGMKQTQEKIEDLTSLHVCACPKPGPGFTTSYVMDFLLFSELR
jgi:hypothetical protein